MANMLRQRVREVCGDPLGENRSSFSRNGNRASDQAVAGSRSSGCRVPICGSRSRPTVPGCASHAARSWDWSLSRSPGRPRPPSPISPPPRPAAVRSAPASRVAASPPGCRRAPLASLRPGRGFGPPPGSASAARSKPPAVHSRPSPGSRLSASRDSQERTESHSPDRAGIPRGRYGGSGLCFVRAPERSCETAFHRDGRRPADWD